MREPLDIVVSSDFQMDDKSSSKRIYYRIKQVSLKLSETFSQKKFDLTEEVQKGVQEIVLKQINEKRRIPDQEL